MTPSRSLFSWSGLIAAALVLPVLHAQTPAPGTSAPGTSAPGAFSGITAIVGARIIDGSGNAPFDGSVVIRGDRIAEVGRAVKPPEGARIVDAQGKTIMPGLVDLGVQLPRGAGDDVTARALAAYLYAGVTSIVPANLPAGEVDALRDRILRAGLRGPRLVVASDATRLARGSASGGALADAQAFTDWKQRNVTYVPELALAAPGDRRTPTPLLQEMTAGDAAAGGNGGSSNGAPGPAPGPAPADSGAAAGLTNASTPGGAAPAAAADPARWKSLLDQTRAARDAGVRLGVGSGGGTATAGPASATASSDVTLPHGWATLLATRLLVDAGITPLQAVTAATSGGTWALGLQSDRGFLAVGQRADLLIVTGDPSATIGDLERIDRVFLGGDDIDRAALRALITRPAAAPPSAADPTATAPATAAGATSARITPPDPRTAAGRRALREARANRGKAGATTAPGSTAAAPGTPPGTAGAAPGATPASPATATGTSGDPAATPSPATSAATGDPAPAYARGASVAVGNALIDDFENGDDSSASTLGTTWTTAAESANSTTTIVTGRVVRGQRDHALHMTARMGTARDSHARVSIKVSQDGRPVDVSRFHSLRFDARGQGRYRVIFVSRSVSDGHYHESYFSGSPNWTPVGIPFASIGQTNATRRVPWTGRDLLEIVFVIARDPGDLGWLELDNIRFY